MTTPEPTRHLRVRTSHGAELTTWQRPRLADFSSAEQLDLSGQLRLPERTWQFDRPVFRADYLPEDWLSYPIRLVTEAPLPPYAIVGFYRQDGFWMPRSRFAVSPNQGAVVQSVWNRFYNEEERSWNAGLTTFLDRCERDAVTPLFLLQDQFVLLAARDAAGRYVDYTDVAARYYIPAWEVLIDETTLLSLAETLEDLRGLLALRGYLAHPDLGDIPLLIPTAAYTEYRLLYQALNPRLIVRSALEGVCPEGWHPQAVQAWQAVRLYYLQTCEELAKLVQLAHTEAWTGRELYAVLGGHRLGAVGMKAFRHPALPLYEAVAKRVLVLTATRQQAENLILHAVSVTEEP